MTIQPTKPRAGDDLGREDRASGGAFIILVPASILGGLPAFLIGPPPWLGLPTPDWAWAVLWACLFAVGASFVLEPSPRFAPLYGFLLLFLCLGLWALLQPQDFGFTEQMLPDVFSWIVVLAGPLVMVVAAVLPTLTRRRQARQ